MGMAGFPVTVPVMLGRREGRGLVERMVWIVVMGRIVVAMMSVDWLEVVMRVTTPVSEGEVPEVSEEPKAEADAEVAAVVVVLL